MIKVENTDFMNTDELIFRVYKDIKPYYNCTGNFDSDFEITLEKFYADNIYYFNNWSDNHFKKVARIIRLARAKMKKEYQVKSGSFGYCD